MSGYLGSLAVHGVTPGPRLRPLALPFAAPSIARPGTLELEAEIPAAAQDAGLQPSAAGAVNVSLGRDSAPRAPLALPEAIVLLTDPPSHSRNTSPAAAPTSQRRVDSSSIRDDQRAIGEPAASSRRAELAASRPARDRSAPPHQPARLTPPAMTTPVAPPTGPAPTAACRHEAARGRDRSAPDVHIHIGRIELTAVTPPAPPRRTTAATTAAMPLDEYLQRRSGRTR